MWTPLRTALRGRSTLLGGSAAAQSLQQNGWTWPWSCRRLVSTGDGMMQQQQKGGAAPKVDAETNALRTIRNIGIMAHIDAGKTTCTERMLYYAGMMRSIGSVDDGTTQMDFLEEERARGITIAAAATTFGWGSHKVNLIDTPGHVDFTVEVERALRVLDGAVVVFDGISGVQAQTLTVWRQRAKHSVPTIGFVNKMDREGASMKRTLASIEEKLGVTPVALQIPVRTDHAYVGVLDLVEMEQLTWDDAASEDGSEFERIKLVADSDRHREAYSEALEGRAHLAEQLADLDDDFAELVLDDTFDPATLNPTALKRVLRKITLEGRALPVLCGTGRRNKGIQPLMDGIVNYLPSPLDRPVVEVVVPSKDGKKEDAVVALTTSPDAPLCALAFKVVYDSYTGATTYLRVYSGKLPSPSTLINSTNGAKERITRLLVVHADHHTQVQEAGPGSIVVAVGMKNTRTGDTIISSNASKLRGARLRGIDIPEAVFTCSIEAQSSQDEKEFEEALICMQKEDPSVRVTTDEETGQLLISGMGELHLEIVCSRLLSQYKVKCNTGPMQVAYRERPTVPTEGSHTLDRLMGGKQQFAQVELAVEVLDHTSPPEVVIATLEPLDYEVEEAVREGILAACSRGALKGYPLVGLRVVVRTIEKPEETSLGAVALCVSECTGKLLRVSAKEQQGVCLLQPVMKLEVTAINDDVGSVLTDLTGTREATVMGVEMISDTTQTIKAVVALPGMLGYDSVLRKLTSGTGSFSMEYGGHQDMTEQQASNI